MNKKTFDKFDCG